MEERLDGEGSLGLDDSFPYVQYVGWTNGALLGEDVDIVAVAAVVVEASGWC